jgi:hypothetical protein
MLDITGTFLDNMCLIFVFIHSINYEIKYIKKTQEYCMFEGFIKTWIHLYCFREIHALFIK